MDFRILPAFAGDAPHSEAVGGVRGQSASFVHVLAPGRHQLMRPVRWLGELASFDFDPVSVRVPLAA